MRKANDDVHAGKVPFRPRERCYPAGVPGFVVYTLAEPFYFIQTARQVTIIDQGGPEVRRIYLDVPDSPQPTPSWYAMEILLSIDDPGAFTMPWSAIQRFRRGEPGPLREDLCAENNPNFFGYDPVAKPHAETPDF